MKKESKMNGLPNGASPASAKVTVPRQSLWKQVMKHWEFYVLLLPGIIVTIVYKYAPIYGIQIAFRDYNAMDGFFGSVWVGLKWFERFFNNYNSVRMIKNTVLLSLYSILWTFPIPIILALLINQVKWKKFQRVSQTILYAPHFISIMILCGMLRIFLSPYGGLISIIMQAFGAEQVNLIDSSSAFRTIYIASSIWQDAGWGCIIYLATLANVDPGLYEAAKVDGASIFQRIRNIDIPELLPMAILNLIMAAGGLMNVGFEKVWLLQMDLNKAASDVIAVYVYQQGIESAKYSYSTAVGLFNTVVNIVLLLIVNKIASKASDVEFV